jgi:hypothetical protein
MHGRHSGWIYIDFKGNGSKEQPSSRNSNNSLVDISSLSPEEHYQAIVLFAVMKVFSSRS